jgi:hypothetical protein
MRPLTTNAGRENPFAQDTHLNAAGAMRIARPPNALGENGQIETFAAPAT